MTAPKRFSEAAFVPDLSPEAHPEARDFRPKMVFVAESPHVSEVAPERVEERRPLCGVAGRQWWGKLSEVLEGERDEDVSLERLLRFCQRHRIAVMNAVQYPLDPGVARQFPEADPNRVLGFSKAAGESSYKKLKSSPQVRAAIARLRERLLHPSVADCPVYPLGNDAEWFITQALGKDEASKRVLGKIPHPSAWWRRGGEFGRIAEEKLRQIWEAAPGLATSASATPRARARRR